MLDFFLEAMPRPHVAKQNIADLSRLLIEPIHRPPCGKAEGALGGLRPGLRRQTLKLLWRKPAIPNRVLQPHVPMKAAHARVGLRYQRDQIA